MIDFLKHLPVRRQTACKTSAKMTTKIKTKLRSYALARPSTRFSQKVIKKKNDKADWTYTPTVGATMSDAASKIFGQGATAQCNWYAWSSAKGTRPSEPEDHSSDVPNNIHDEFTIESLIPRKDCGMLFQMLSNLVQLRITVSRNSKYKQQRPVSFY